MKLLSTSDLNQAIYLALFEDDCYKRKATLEILDKLFDMIAQSWDSTFYEVYTKNYPPGHANGGDRVSKTP